MCLAIPGKVEERLSSGDTPMGKVDFGGVLKEVCLAFTPDAQVGDYVIVHAGFAISAVDETAARQTLEMFASLGIPADDAADEDTEEGAE